MSTGKEEGAGRPASGTSAAGSCSNAPDASSTTDTADGVESSDARPDGAFAEDFEIPASQLVIEEHVGSGVTAEVYRGHWAGQVVAIKQIKEETFRRRIKEQVAFTREMAVLTKISHENLVRLFGVSFAERPMRIITQFCEGGDCFELLHSSPVELSWKQKFKMSEDVAVAMDYLHQCTPQIIHRDLKSLNLLLALPVTSTDVVPLVKVSDFGVSRIKDDQDSWGKMTVQAGTWNWMAPEVFEGSTYDEKVDIYSYAMVLYEILARRVPFEDVNPAKVGLLVVTGRRPDLRVFPPDCPELLRDIMICCWEHDPRERPTFASVVTQLRGGLM